MLTPEQIKAVALLWADAEYSRRFSQQEGIETEDYFAGKAFAICETFALIMGIGWPEANDILKAEVEKAKAA